MRASVLIGGLIAAAIVLLFLPALGRDGTAPEPAVEAAAPAQAETAPPALRELLRRPDERAALAGAVAHRRWSEVPERLPQPPLAVEDALLLGLARLQAGRPDEALGPLEHAARRARSDGHPLAALAWRRLAAAAKAADRPALRLEALEAAGSHGPSAVAERAELAAALHASGRRAEALELVRRAAGEPAGSPGRAALLAFGLGLGSDEEGGPPPPGPVDEAERRRWLAELGWRHAAERAARGLAGSEEWEAELGRAIEAGEWARVLERLEALVVADLARTALAEIEALLEAGPPAAERDRARQLEVRAQWVRRQHAKALAAARKVGDSDAEVLARARYFGALSARSLKRRGDYRRMLEEAAAGPPNEWRDRALERLADIDEQAGRHEKARERRQRLAREAVQEERRAEAAWLRAWSFHEEGRVDSALAAFTEVAADHPRRHAAAAALYWSARLLREGGAPEEAGRRLRALVEEHPFDYYGLLAARELHVEPARPPLAAAGELEERLVLRLEELAERDRPAAERAAALWRIGMVEALTEELAAADLLGGEAGDWALEVALLGECGRHRDALVALREAVPDWRTRPDLPAIAWEGAYPRAYARLVEGHSRENGLDPALVYALIHQESVFDADAVSHAGARGLMQIMPGTNRTIARWFRERAHASDLSDPEHNVRYGTAYLRRLLDNLGEPELALAGYNAGGTRARRWWKGLPEQDLALFVESIPFDETRHYVKSVTWNRHLYRGRLEPAPALGQ